MSGFRMTKLNQYEQQAKDFLDETGVKFTAKQVGHFAPPWTKPGERHGLEYRILLERKNSYGVTESSIDFPFWDSINNMEGGPKRKRINDQPVVIAPTAYHVLACISSDANCPETFHDFCGEYGYDEDSREAFKTWERVLEFSRKLKAFFTAEELERLAEIQ